MLFFKKKPKAQISIFNTQSREKEVFTPIRDGKVKMYSCGPTVYDYLTIGNLRAYVFSDIVRRTFEYAGYDVRQVVNITDFGHLVSDGDTGEDKMTLALKREGKELTMDNMFAVASVYTQAFENDLKEMNIKTPHVMPRASQHVGGQIAYVEVLLDKGFAYKTSDGIYFDTEHFSHYGALGGSDSTEHSRLNENSEKKHSRDFALWKFNEDLGWDAPWGKGFPGWHIECTAMSTHYLGKTFDIHTGGIDHIAIHHNNEIAQAEAANNKPLAHYWLHNEFITIDAKRIGKSVGNAITLKQLADKGISPLAYRYWLLTGHYRQGMNFTWDAVNAAQTALQRAWRILSDIRNKGSIVDTYKEKFERALYDDFNTAEAVAVLWELLRDESVSDSDKKATAIFMDQVLGVGLGSAPSRIEKLKVSVVAEAEVPESIQALIQERETARSNKKFEEADKIREEIEKHGFQLEDGADGPVVKRL